MGFLRRFWPLGLLLGFILFPLEALGTVWLPLGSILDRYFVTNLSHYIVHFLLFTSLGSLILLFFPRLSLLAYLGLGLAAGCGQELFQLWFKQRGLAFDDFRDLAVDLVALSVAFALATFWWQRPVVNETRRQ